MNGGVEQIDEDAILEQHLGNRQNKQQNERAAVLRGYNYYRIVLSFFLIILFYEVPDQTFAGTFEPQWFQSIVLFYLILNVTSPSGYWLTLGDGAYRTPQSPHSS